MALQHADKPLKYPIGMARLGLQVQLSLGGEVPMNLEVSPKRHFCGVGSYNEAPDRIQTQP